MIEFTINNRTYRTTSLGIFRQFHVARRILPVLAKLPEMIGMTAGECLKQPESIVAVIADNIDAIRLDVIADTLVSLKNEDVDYILEACMDAVEIKEAQGIGWAKVSRNGRIMYDFLGMTEAMGFAVNVIKDNLADFFSGNAPISSGAAMAAVAE